MTKHQRGKKSPEVLEFLRKQEEVAKESRRKHPITFIILDLITVITDLPGKIFPSLLDEN